MRKDLMMNEKRYVGSENQLLSARRITFRDGMSDGVRAIELQNSDGLYTTCLEDQCLNLFDLRYKGINFAFQSKNGLVSNRYFNGGTNEFSYYWPAGMVYTCGLTNTGPGVTEDGIYHPDHGRIGMMPARNVAMTQDENGVTITGTVQDGFLAGHRLELARTIRFPAKGKEIQIFDTVTNREAIPAEYMLLYHCNFGYPLLTPDVRILKGKGTGYDKYSDNPLPADCFASGEPQDHKVEELYCHTNTADKDGFAYAAIINDELELGCYVKYRMDTLPLLLHWKNMCSHDYVIGLEPSNSHIMGRTKEREHGTLPVLEGYASCDFHMALGVLDGKEEIAAFEAMLNTL